MQSSIPSGPIPANLDGEALSVFAHERAEGAPVDKKERKRLMKEAKAEKRRLAKEEREMRRTSQSADIQRQLKARDKQLQSRHRAAKRARAMSDDMITWLPWEAMYSDGTCVVVPPKKNSVGLYSETIEFDDISYQTARRADQEAVFDRMCGLLEEYGPDKSLQFTVWNEPIDVERLDTDFFDVDAQPEQLAPYADEANTVIERKMAEGKSTLRRRRFVTYSTGAYSIDDAVRSLASMRVKVSDALNEIGSHAHLLDGKERAGAIARLLRPGVQFDFDYERDITARNGLTVKDFVAPQLLDFKAYNNSRDDTFFLVDGKTFGQVLVVRDITRLTDTAFASIVDLPIPLAITWHLQGWDQAKALLFAAQRSNWIDAEIISEQQSALRRGYDGSIVPYALSHSKAEAREVLDGLENRGQNLYEFSALICTWADTIGELTDQAVNIIDTARAHGLAVEVLPKRQRHGLSSMLPVGANSVEVGRMMSTGQCAILSPFATAESYMAPGREYIGVNKLSNNPVGIDIKALKNPSGLVSGKPRSGKSFAVKQLIMSVIMGHPPIKAAQAPRDCAKCGWIGVTEKDFCPDCGAELPEAMADQIIILDPAAEYEPSTEAAGGRIMRMMAGTDTHFNIFAVNGGTHDDIDERVMAQKISAICAFTAAMAHEAGTALSDEERSIINRCVSEAYDLAGKRGEVPILQDFYESLKRQPEDVAQRLALRYERFVSGPNSFLNHQSNIDWNRRVIDMSIKDLPDDIRTPVIIAQLEAVRQQVFHNFDRGITTWLFVDELQSLLRHQEVIDYLSRFWSELPKFNLISIGIVQNASLIARTRGAATIASNSDFCLLFAQSAEDAEAWARLKGLSESELKYIDENVNPGEGLVLAGKLHIPIRGEWPAGLMYDLMNTKASEVAEKKLKERFEAARKGLEK